MIEEIKKRVEATMCPTYSSDGGDKGVEGRISRADFDTLLSTTTGPLVATFGHGQQVVTTGTVEGKPAVFVGKAGTVGTVGEEVTNEDDKLPSYTLSPGEWYMLFPSEEQAKRVADALVTPSKKGIGTIVHVDSGKQTLAHLAHQFALGESTVVHADLAEEGTDITSIQFNAEDKLRATKAFHTALGSADGEDFGDTQSSRWCKDMVDLIIGELTIGAAQRS